MLRRYALDKQFFSEPPDFTNIFSSKRTNFQPHAAIYSIKSLHTLKVLLAEKKKNKEHPVLRFLVDNLGQVWFARETHPQIDTPKHYQMTGVNMNDAQCLSAGNIKFKRRNCRVLKNINHKSGDFHPSFHSLRIFLAILIINEHLLAFKLPRILTVKELNQQGETIKKHRWPTYRIRKWVAENDAHYQLSCRLIQKNTLSRTVHYNPKKLG